MSDTRKSNERQWLIPEEGREHLAGVFKKLPGKVTLDVFTDGDEQNVYNDYAIRFAEELALLAENIEARTHTLDSEEAKRFDVTIGPGTLLNADDYSIRFTGAPLGEEARGFIEAIMLVSAGKGAVTPAFEKALEKLTEERTIRVFSSPGCPYCPGQVVNAVRAAIAKPELVRAEAINSDEFPELSQKYGVGSVPHTNINDTFDSIGLMPEERFVLELVTLQSAEELTREAGGTQDARDDYRVEKVDLVIVGAGPAGLTAGIYAERSGLKSVVLDKSVAGGQVAVTPTVENYPGFKNVGGMNLVEVLTAHTRQYSNVREHEGIEEIKIGKNIEVYTAKTVFLANALIFATGSQWRELGVEGEDTYFGKGVSHCASCDGYMFKGKKIIIVGGGNTAATDALHLKNLGVDVTLVHRRDELRAEQQLQDALKRDDVPIIWDTVVEEIKGKDGVVTGAVLKNVKSGETEELALDGVFVAVGHVANSELAAQIGVNLNSDGTIAVDRSMRTNIPRIYAAGDVTGGIRQIVTAVGEGATAALSAFEDLQSPRWKK
ncbi:FAD-dependent oxidoreductase [Oleidesulfovibrio sp.]|uniref:FAD-dependent oxidoreductase n=1 Tax=Oleidesulfovibrio sp. TaxID=2909707 RepID=UPI003A85282A